MPTATISPETLGYLFAAFEAKDLETILTFFADDAVVIDPRYPVMPLQGKVAIREGFAWAFRALKQRGFTPRHVWMDGSSGAVEVETHHRLRGGMEASFPQVFIFETRNGLITRLQAYVPYGPHGIQGLYLRLARLGWRLRRKPG
jgi:ketosteroid isomerase-like protein